MDILLHIFGWSCLVYIVFLIVTLPGLFSTPNAKYRTSPFFYFSYGFLLNKKLPLVRKLVILLLVIAVIGMIILTVELITGLQLSL